MKSNRRLFLKSTGLAGFGLIEGGIFKSFAKDPLDEGLEREE